MITLELTNNTMTPKEKLEKAIDILNELWLDVPMNNDSMLNAYTSSIERLAKARVEVTNALNLLEDIEL